MGINHTNYLTRSNADTTRQQSSIMGDWAISVALSIDRIIFDMAGIENL